MNIDLYIVQLLHRYQCINVPSFGAFLTEIQSAQWIENQNSFHPPKKLISFNAILKNNDGLLANHIATTANVSYDDALNIIENEVSIWKKELETNGFFSIKNIGSLSLNSDKNIVFKPYEQVNYLTSSFGLSSFVSPPVSRDVAEKAYTIQQEEELVETETFLEHDSTFTHKTFNPYLKYAAILVIGFGLTASIGYPIYLRKMEQRSLLIDVAVQKKVNDKIQEATFFINAPIPAITLTIKEADFPYHVVAAAFRDEKNAIKKREYLTKLGYDSQIIKVNEHGLYPVSYGSYATLEQADSVMLEIKKNYNSSAWIMIDTIN